MMNDLASEFEMVSGKKPTTIRGQASTLQLLKDEVRAFAWWASKEDNRWDTINGMALVVADDAPAGILYVDAEDE